MVTRLVVAPTGQWSVIGQSVVVLICHLLTSEVFGASVMDVFFTLWLTIHVTGLSTRRAVISLQTIHYGSNIVRTSLTQ